MSEEKEIHPAVALLLKRMDSNPQEFLDGEWATAEEAISAYATEEELKLVEEKLGKLWMDHTHETMLKHLFKVDEKDVVQEAVNTKWGNKVIDPKDQLKLQYPYSAYGKGVGAGNTPGQSAMNPQDRFDAAYKKAVQEMEYRRMNHMAKQQVQPPAPEKPHLRQILPGPRPLQILRGFFKGRA